MCGAICQIVVKIIILDESDRLTEKAQTSLKKPLEELNLYIYNGVERTLYNIKHSVFITLRNAGASLDYLARMRNTSVPMLIGSYLKSQEKEGLAFRGRDTERSFL